MNRDDRAVAVGTGTNLHAPLSDSQGRLGEDIGGHAEPDSALSEKTDVLITGDQRHLRVDRPEHSARSRSESLQWLVFSRIVIPLVILVGGAVLIQRARVWFRPGIELERIIRDVRSGGAARWQALVQIASLLRDSRYADVRRNPELAEALSEAFREELRQPLNDQSDMSVVSRKYLCFVLYQMEDETVVPALCEGVTWWGLSTPQAGSPVRRVAVEGLYEMANRLGPQVLRESPEVMPALCAAASDPIDPVRAEAALTLGLHGGPEACETLERLLDDPAPNVRYSAAIGLGMAGSPKGLPVLNELFQCDEVERLAVTGNTESIFANRACRLVFLGLRSVESLLDTHPNAEVDMIRPAVTHLCGSHVPRHVKEVAFRVESKMKHRSRIWER